MLDKRNIFLWALYDFANSIVVIVFFLYFSQWLVVDQGVPDIWFNALLTGGAIMTVLLGPVLSGWCDRIGGKKRFLIFATIGVMVFSGTAAIIALYFPALKYVAAVAFMFTNFCYLLSFAFYNSMLIDIAPPERAGLISGIGQSSNWIGQMAGLILALPFVKSIAIFADEPSRAQALIPAVIVFSLLSLPMLFWFRDKSAKGGAEWEISDFRLETSLTWQKFRNLLVLPGVTVFLLAFFFYNDGILTLTNNFPIYVEKVFAVSDTIKTQILLLILITTAAGASLAGYLSDKYGHLRVLRYIILSWVIILPFMAIAPDIKWFTVASTLVGLSYGAIAAVSRAYMSDLVHTEHNTFGFSFYTVAERFATITGPLVWGSIVTGFSYMGGAQYRIAAMVMAIFVVIGYFILVKKTTAPVTAPFKQ